MIKYNMQIIKHAIPELLLNFKLQTTQTTFFYYYKLYIYFYSSVSDFDNEKMITRDVCQLNVNENPTLQISGHWSMWLGSNSSHQTMVSHVLYINLDGPHVCYLIIAK